MGTRAEQSLDYTALPGLPGALQVVEAALLQNCYTRQLLQCRGLRPAAQVHPSASARLQRLSRVLSMSRGTMDTEARHLPCLAGW